MIDPHSLVLLIGTNPLPSYVVAHHFVSHASSIKNIFFIHSEETPSQRGTKGYAEKIRDLLIKRHPGKNLEFKFIPLSDIALATRIAQDLSRRLKDNLRDSKSIHFNYTGGTKCMGIQVHEFLQRNFAERVSFSYLDARTFQIVLDDDRGRVTGDLRKEIKLKPEEIFGLHGFQREEPSTRNLSRFEQAISIFRELIEGERLDSYFRSFDRSKFTEQGKLITKVERLREKLKEYHLSEPALNVALALPEELRIFERDGRFKADSSNRTAEKALKFLDGEWLEYYVYDVLVKNIGNECAIDWDIKLKGEKWAKGFNFQLDLVLVKGYQVLGISCTTASDRALIKSKGFEIFLRSRQIGGEEAKSVLVTTLPREKTESLSEELQIDTGGSENLIVLGKEDLKGVTLVNRIEQFLG